MGIQQKRHSAELDQVLRDFANEEESGGQPTRALDPLEVFTSQEQTRLAGSAPTAEVAVGDGSSLQIVDLDQSLTEFMSEEQLTLTAAPGVAAKIPDSPRQAETYPDRRSPSARAARASEPRAAGHAASAPVTIRYAAARRTSLALTAAAATIVLGSVAAIGVWQIALQPKEAVSRGPIGRPIASNQPPAAPVTGAEPSGANPAEETPGAAEPASQPADRPSGLVSPVAGGDRSPLEALTSRSSSSSQPLTATEPVTSSAPPATSTTAPQVTTTQGSVGGNRIERPAPEAPNLPSVSTSNTATPAVTVPVRIETDPALRPSESSAPAALRADLSAPSLPGPPAAPPVEAVSSPSVNEAAAVHDLLSRYRTAYEQLDARLAKQIYPGVNERALARAFDGLESQAVTFESCNVDVGEGRAAASCRGTATYVRRVGNKSSQTLGREWTFVLRKAEDGWLIQTVQMR